MRFISIAPAALLICSSVATPVVQSHARRQLDGLGAILNLLKGTMNQSSGDSNTVNTDTSAAAGYQEAAECADAIAKIDSALTLSGSIVGASGDTPTMRQIDAVLSVLEQSLDQCDPQDNDDERRVSRRQVDTGIVASFNLTGTTQGGGNDGDDDDDDDNDEDEGVGPVMGDSGEDNEADEDDGDDGNDVGYSPQPNYSPQPGSSPNPNGGRLSSAPNPVYRNSTAYSSSSEDFSDEAVEIVTTKVIKVRATGCSDCERELYGIVVSLRSIFSMGAGSQTQAATNSIAKTINNANGNADEGQAMRFAQAITSQAEVVKANAMNMTTTGSPSQMRRRAIGRMFSQ